MTIKEANAIVKQNKECCEKIFKGECRRIRCMGCEKFDFLKTQEVQQMAFRSLEAWEKVLERLTKMANDKWNEQVGSSKGLNDAIEVIEDILSEVEDEQTKR